MNQTERKIRELVAKGGFNFDSPTVEAQFKVIDKLRAEVAEKDAMIAVLRQDKDAYRQGLHDAFVRAAERTRYIFNCPDLEVDFSRWAKEVLE